jgi:transglutaminase-like putative cysteine protease
VKRPRTRALLPQSVARLVGLAALAAVGALEWQRLVAGLSSGRALLWVAVAVAAAIGVLAAERVPSRFRLRVLALPAAAILSLFAGYWLSGAGLDLLKPRHWDELLSGLGGGLQALGTVRLPYVSTDPWPRIVLELLGAELLILAGLLTFWPRAATAAQARVPLAPPDRGYPFVALAVLLVVIASPVVSLGGSTSSLVLGLTLAALTVCFLWLERLPLKPGLGVAALLAVALAGALPLAAVADRGQPWFDYRSFAESLGPDDPIRFSWTQSYGPITWPRDGNEVMRIVSKEPRYWKARNLDVFNHLAWTTRSKPPQDVGDEPFESDLPLDWEDTPAWTSTIDVSIRRMRITDVIGAGTTVDVRNASRNVEQAISPGTWEAPSTLRRGDSYTAEVHVPDPTQELLEQASSGSNERQADQRVITVPFKPGEVAPVRRRAAGILRNARIGPVTEAEVHFKAWDGLGQDYAAYPMVRRSEFDVDKVMKRSKYERTWELSKQLKQGAEYPMDYIRAVDEYLSQPEFRYVERPRQPPADQAPLDFFLNESHEGYCQHYAGAMALLLRMGGLSARVATGFSPGGYSARKKAWIVRDTDAHAWVEVWFDKFGWITIDPTPDATPARSQVAALAPAPGATPPTAAADTGAGDAAANTERPNLTVRPELQVGSGDGALTAADEGGVPFWAWALGVLGVVAVVLAVLLFLRRPRGNTPLDRAIAEVEDALRRVGRPVTTGTTMTQLERRLGSHSPEVSAYLHALASARYAPSPTPPPRAGRRALRRALAQGLGFGARTRALWALPPRLDRRPRERTRTLEVETRVRA